MRMRSGRSVMLSLTGLLFLLLGAALAVGAPQSQTRKPAVAPAGKNGTDPADKPINRSEGGSPNAPAKAQTKKPAEASLLRRVIFYVPSRLADFLDIWRFNAGIGLGLGANIRPTKTLQFGFAAYDSTRFGIRGRRWPFWHEWSLEGGFDGAYQELGDTERGFYEFGGTIHFILVGLDAALNVEEAIDFVFGVFLKDPLDDDFR